MTQGEGTIVTGAGSQTGEPQPLGRLHEHERRPDRRLHVLVHERVPPANGSFNWRTRIGSFKFPGCGDPRPHDFSISASPASLSVGQGASGTSTISTAVTSGSAQTRRAERERRAGGDDRHRSARRR